jgi:hypothetical protein
MTDLNKGNISPRKTLLQRQLQNPDSKRIHNGENSKPITLNFDEAI